MKYSQYFHNEYTRNGEEYLVISFDAPKRLQEFIEDLHNDLHYSVCPDNWVMNLILEMFDSETGKDAKDIIIPDDFMGSLLDWVSKSSAIQYVNEILEKGPKPKNFKHLLQEAQGLAKRDIYDKVAEFMEYNS